MKRKLFVNITAVIVLISMIASITGCKGNNDDIQAKNLMKGIKAQNISKVDSNVDICESAGLTDFAVRLFKTCISEEKEGENLLISPLSVMCALAITSNGAKEDTKEAMEDVLGMSVDELNVYIRDYVKALPQDEKCKLSLANSIWFTDHKRFTVNQDFLQKNANWYNADIYQAPFNENTCNDINQWVKEKTEGMIPKILDEIPENAVMYLINALAFDAEWQSKYLKSQVREGTFTAENGTDYKVDFMYSEEGKYLEDEMATGFIKYYKDGKYAFVALLPNEDVALNEYIQSLTGEHIDELLKKPENITVYASVPKFEAEYGVEMKDILTEMGMEIAFNHDEADFSGLGTSTEGNIAINRVIHKTFISVDKDGTKAGAATVVEMTDECASVIEDFRTVYLDRPFVYMLIECETNTPFFIGTLANME